jgi:hypothetical protein
MENHREMQYKSVHLWLMKAWEKSDESYTNFIHQQVITQDMIWECPDWLQGGLTVINTKLMVEYKVLNHVTSILESSDVLLRCEIAYIAVCNFFFKRKQTSENTTCVSRGVCLL